MKIVITIEDDIKAERFLDWVLFRGDFFYGDTLSTEQPIVDSSGMRNNPSYLFISEAHEATEAV